MKHALTRTSPKGAGQTFIGTCTQCGEQNLPASAVQQDCPNVRGLSEEDALIEVLSSECEPPATVLQDLLRCAKSWTPEARIVGNVRAGDIAMACEFFLRQDLNRAIQHAVNYHGLDARLNMPDWQIADLIEGEMQKHLGGQTDVQIIERMTPEERSRIGQEH